jgi:NAD dependent epimerase/dehydratase family enzyme
MFLNIQGPVLGSTKLLRRTRLNEDQERDILNMFGNVPVIHIALKHFLAMSLSKPFTVKIPKLKLQNDFLKRNYYTINKP